jgi:cholesterol oxidase
MSLRNSSNSIKQKYDVVVIGSGYGGSITAARLSEKNYSVCVLEKGKEYRKGDFPNSFREFVSSVNVNVAPILRNHLGLFDFRHFKDLDILMGSGLGGGSLINAGVMEKPSPEVMQSEEWPKEIRENLEELEKFYELSIKTLEADIYPNNREGYAHLKKYHALDSIAKSESMKSQKVNLTINFTNDKKNSFGIEQESCIGCGNCFTGCNYNAKNSLDKNYLKIAKDNSAEIYTCIYVNHIQFVQETNSFLVFYYYLETQFESIDESKLKVIEAEKVFLCAGAIGTTEILLRSQNQNGLKLSDQIGKHFSGNGGFISGGINVDYDINLMGIKKGEFTDRRVRKEDRRKNRPTTIERRNQFKQFIPLSNFKEQVGPTITMMVDKRFSEKGLPSGHVIEDSAIPGSITNTIPIYWSIALFKNFLNGSVNWSELKKLLNKNFNLSGIQALTKTVIFLGVSHDHSKGKLFLSTHPNSKLKEVDLLWSGYIDQENIQNLRKDMFAIVEKMNGIFLEYSDVGTRRPLSVHPLGGCVMADNSIDGVVNHLGQVFNSEDKNSIYENLYIADSSMIPRSLGINPLWTISALAERINSYIPHKAEGEKIKMLETQNSTNGIQFSEFFTGYGFSNQKENYEFNFQKGKDIGLSGLFNLNLNVEILDLDDFILTKKTTNLTGSIEAPLLSLKGKLYLLEGSHIQFEEKSDNHSNKYFVYKFLIVSQEGSKFIFKGFKELNYNNYFSTWEETTQLYFDIFEINEQKVLFKGILNITPESFFKNNLGSMKSKNSKSLYEDIQNKSKFISYFTNELIRVYRPKNIFRSINELIPEVKVPELKNNFQQESKEYSIKTKDGLFLQLTHYSQNFSEKKGSVLLLHGLTSSSEMFCMPEHYNLKDYLLNHGYDVWAYDFRMSCKLPYNKTHHDYSFEHVAFYDIPQAVSLIRENISINEKLHLIAHCLGSVSLFHSVCAGQLKGVNSIITNSVSLFCKLPPLAVWKLEYLIKSRFLEDILRVPYVDPTAIKGNDWLQKVISYGNSFVHHECDSAVCHMLSFMWGIDSSALFEHKNILEVTHSRLEQLFGGTSLNFYRHVLKIAKEGRPIPFYENDSRFVSEDYIKGIEKNDIPILFITGNKNKIFWDSNILAFEYLNSFKKSFVDLKVFPDYGHQDIFMGKDVDKDIFPEFLDFWNQI